MGKNKRVAETIVNSSKNYMNDLWSVRLKKN